MGRFCYAPWTDIVISPIRVGPCCFVKFDHRVEDLATYEESDELANLKAKFNAGVEPEECYRCWKAEAAGGHSQRMLTNKEYDHTDGDALDYDILDEGIIDLDMSTGNVCNLECKICCHVGSSRWKKTEQKVRDLGVHIEPMPADRTPISYLLQNEKYMNAVYDMVEQKDIVRITMMGGEPFLGQLEEHVTLLSKLDDDLKELEYITNGTIIPDKRIQEQWHRFNHLTFNISMDGVGDSFEYNRYPAQWNTFKETVEFYLNLRKSRSGVRLNFLTTVGVLSAMGIGEILDWAADKDIHVTLNPLEFPFHYSMRYIPDYVKPLVYEAWKGYNELIPYVNYMEQHPSSGEHLNDTLKHIGAIDQIHNQSFKELFPMFAAKLGL